MASVYILHSPVYDKFYIGFTTEDIPIRVERHNTDYYQDKYTGKYKPWVLFWSLTCSTSKQAQQIEKHIKQMKSRTYLENLKKYSEIGEKLLQKYSTSTDC